MLQATSVGSVAAASFIDGSALFVRSAQLRLQSGALKERLAKTTLLLGPLTDNAVLASAEARRLRAESSRITELRNRRYEFDHQLRLVLEPQSTASSQVFTDGEVFEDGELLAQLNAVEYRCDRCEFDEPLVAVVRFKELSLTLGICGDCYRGLSGLSLGDVT
jgi:hypothetical protein